jgi:hypothetical protein
MDKQNRKQSRQKSKLRGLIFGGREMNCRKKVVGGVEWSGVGRG